MDGEEEEQVRFCFSFFFFHIWIITALTLFLIWFSSKFI